MSTPAEMNERHGRILAKLAKLSELSLTLAVDLHTRALAAEDTDEVAELANAFHKIARGVRQTMALEARLARDAAADARDKAVEDDRTRPLRHAQRVLKVRQQVEHLIWTEVEKDEDAELGVEILADMMRTVPTEPDFLDVPIDALVEEIKTEVLAHVRAIRTEDDEAEEGDLDPPLQNTG